MFNVKSFRDRILIELLVCKCIRDCNIQNGAKAIWGLEVNLEGVIIVAMCKFERDHSRPAVGNISLRYD